MTTNNINFWTPVQYGDQPTSLGQKIGEYADFYFHLGGEVAAAVPGALENNSSGVSLQEGPTPFWKTALKVLSYATLIIPAQMYALKTLSRATYPFHLCHRVLPDGTKETGTFMNGELYQGVRVQGERTLFLRPEVLLGEVQLSRPRVELNFAEVTIEGQKEIIPVQRSYLACDDKYMRYPGSPYEALLKIAQDTTRRYGWSMNLHYGSPVKFLLQHPSNRLLKAEELLTYLITPNAQGALPLHTVNKDSLVEILELAADNHVAINLQTIDPNTHETLFSKWAGTGDAQLTQRLLTIDPSAIRQTEGRDPSFFMKAVMGGHEKEAQLLLQAMETQKIELTPADQWAQKAFTNDCNFTKEQFLALSVEERRQVYQIANIYVQKEFLQKLRECGMYQTPDAPKKAALFSNNMDAIDVENTLQGFLGNLRRDGLLLTKEEFAEKDPTHYYNKGRDVGRILGRDYIERTAKRLNLPYIKAPKKTAVIESDKALEFIVSQGGNMNVQCCGLEIYAEKIEPIDRKTTREEMSGLLDFIEATGFNDFAGYNLFMGKNPAGEEGMYFIDTEYTNFSSMPRYFGIGMLGGFMAAEDHPWLQDELNRRLDLVDQNKSEKEAALQQEWAEQEPVLIEHGFAHRSKPFTFAIADLIG